MNKQQARYLLSAIPTTEKRAAMAKSAVIPGLTTGGIGAGIGALVNLLRGRSVLRGAGVGALTGAGAELGTGLIPIPMLGTGVGAAAGYGAAQHFAGGDPDDAQAAAGDDIAEVEKARAELMQARDKLESLWRESSTLTRTKSPIRQLDHEIDGYSKHIDRLRSATA